MGIIDRLIHRPQNPLEKEEKKLIKKHPYPLPINLPTRKVPIAERIEGMKKVIDLSKNRWEKVYKPKIRTFQNRFQDRKRCFVIGNGPSLNHTDLSKLKREISFATNGIFLKFSEIDFRPSFYLVEDHLVAEDRKGEINALKGFTKLFPIYLAYCLEEGENTIFFNHQPRRKARYGYDFSIDPSVITYAGCTVTFTCLQFAFFMGFKEIYLVGVDYSYALPDSTKIDRSYNVGVLDMGDDDQSHFHKDYFGKGYRWHEPQVEKMGKAYQVAKRVTEEHGCTIFNATKGGKLEIFKRVDYNSLFP